MAALVQQRKRLVFHKAKKKILFVNGKEIYKFKANNKNVNFVTQFCLGSISNQYRVFDSREVSLKGNFSVDFNVIDKFDMLNIHRYVMVKNNI